MKNNNISGIKTIVNSAVILEDINASSDEKLWKFETSCGELKLRLVNDAQDATTLLTINRRGIEILSIFYEDVEYLPKDKP